MKQTRVLIVDDSVTIRAMVEQIVANHPGYEVVGMCSDGDECEQMVLDLRPDVITLDLDMPKMGGIELLARLSSYSRPPIVVLSGSTKAGCDATVNAMRHGADACFDKARLVSHAPSFLKLLSQVARINERTLAA